MSVYGEGIDFAFGNGVTVAQIRAAGKIFVCRYLAGGGNPKEISAAELAAYKAGGIDVVLNWETDGQMLSQADGVAAAQAASAEAIRLGAPASAPIIFTADQPQSGTLSQNLAYMRGVNSVLGYARTGMYAVPGVLSAYFSAGIGKYGWQDGGSQNEVPQAQLQQYAYNIMVGPAQCDADRAYVPDFGQIQWGAKPPPPPIEEDMPQPLMLVHGGPAQVLPVPSGATKVTLYCDYGFNGQVAPSIRVGTHPNWATANLSPSWNTPAVFSLPSGTTEVTFGRLDTGSCPVTPAFS